MAKKKEKKEKKAGKRMSKKQLAALLIDFFHAKQSETLSMKYIFSELHLTTHPQKMLCVDILHEMLDDDYISEIEKGKFRLNNHGTEMTGTFQRKSNGKNSFIPEGGGDPIFVAERNSAHAMNNDKVKITFYAKRKNKDAEGEVIEILERANDTFVGTLEVAKSYAFLVTENRTLANDIFIPKEKLKGGKTGDKAIVKVTEWPVGVSDYVRAQAEYYYVDKTLLIKEFLDRKPLVSLFTRPRRFGKTLNMDMLRVFFEISDEDTSIYFKEKAIWKCGQEYTRQQGNNSSV